MSHLIRAADGHPSRVTERCSDSFSHLWEKSSGPCIVWQQRWLNQDAERREFRSVGHPGSVLYGEGSPRLLEQPGRLQSESMTSQVYTASWTQCHKKAGHCGHRSRVQQDILQDSPCRLSVPENCGRHLGKNQVVSSRCGSMVEHLVTMTKTLGSIPYPLT